MIDNFIYTAFPFYDSTDKQNYRKKWLYNDLCTVPLITPINRLLPFMVNRKTRYNPVTHLYLYDTDDIFVSDLLTDIPTGDLKITTANNLDYIYYYGNKDLTNTLDCGRYYLHLTDGVNNWYSEVFTVCDCTWGVTRKVKIATGVAIPSVSLGSNNLTPGNSQIISTSYPYNTQ